LQRNARYERSALLRLVPGSTPPANAPALYEWRSNTTLETLTRVAPAVPRTVKLTNALMFSDAAVGHGPNGSLLVLVTTAVIAGPHRSLPHVSAAWQVVGSMSSVE